MSPLRKSRRANFVPRSQTTSKSVGHDANLRRVGGANAEVANGVAPLWRSGTPNSSRRSLKSLDFTIL